METTPNGRRMKVNGKFVIGSVVMIILIIGGYLFARKVETTIYLGIANPSQKMDLLVKIDDRSVFSDTIGYNPFKYIIIKEHLRGGFHKLYVHSNKEHLTAERNILIIFNQHVVIEYFPKDEQNQIGKSLSIRNRLSPFYLE